MKKFIMLIVILMFTANCYAAPKTVEVRGPIKDGEKVTIIGSGFGTKSPAAPYFYDNFNSGANGAELHGKRGTVGDKTWTKYLTLDSPVYDNKIYYGAKGLAASKRSDGDDFVTAGINGMMGTTAYLSYNYRWDADHSIWEGCVFKLARITSQGGWYTTIPSIYPQYQIGKNWFYDGFNNGLGGSENYSFGRPEKKYWNRAEIYMKLSTPGGAENGIVQTWYNEKINMNLHNVVTRSSSMSGRYLDSFILPFQVANNPNNDYTFHADNVYFDTTQARVVMCDTDTWNARQHCDIQIPFFWKDDEIKIDVNQGYFSADSTAYVYVINSLGAVSNGHKVTIGKDEGGEIIDTRKPHVIENHPVRNLGEKASLNGAEGIIIFSEAIDPDSVTKETLIFEKADRGVLTAQQDKFEIVSVENNIITLLFSNLEPEMLYKMSLKTGITDLASNPLFNEHSFFFESEKEEEIPIEDLIELDCKCVKIIK